MSLISNLGKRIGPALGIAAAGAYGFSSGLGSNSVSDNLFEFATGDPNFDEYALGQNVSARALLLPVGIPGIGDLTAIDRVNNTMGATTGGAAFGAGVGALVGGLKGGSVRNRIGWGLATGIIGGIGGGAAGFKGMSGGYINRTTVNDSLRARRYNNNMPTVSGEMVLGMYDTRMGGY